MADLTLKEVREWRQQATNWLPNTITRALDALIRRMEAEQPWRAEGGGVFHRDRKDPQYYCYDAQGISAAVRLADLLNEQGVEP